MSGGPEEIGMCGGGGLLNGGGEGKLLGRRRGGRPLGYETLGVGVREEPYVANCLKTVLILGN